MDKEGRDEKEAISCSGPFSAAVMTFGTVSFGEAAESLQIKEQGIFSAGGTVLHSPGTFDISHYYTSREGSTAHVDHANVLYEVPQRKRAFPWSFSMAMVSPARDGWRRRTASRAGRISFCATVTVCTLLMNRAVVRQGQQGRRAP